MENAIETKAPTSVVNIDEQVSAVLDKETLPGRSVSEELEPIQARRFRTYLRELEKSPVIESLRNYLEHKQAYIACSSLIEYKDARCTDGLRAKRTYGILVLTSAGFRILHQTHDRKPYYRSGGNNPFHADYAFKLSSSTGFYRIFTTRRLVPLARITDMETVQAALNPVIQALGKEQVPNVRLLSDIDDDIRPFSLRSDFSKSVNTWRLEQYGHHMLELGDKEPSTLSSRFGNNTIL
ncbi:MAG: hypothetical protein R3A13_05705 [Bdellovibrionota bacterium]